jgi:hypothetical protein
MLKFASVLAIAAVSATAFASVAEAGGMKAPRHGRPSMTPTPIIIKVIEAPKPTYQTNDALNLINQTSFGGKGKCGSCGGSEQAAQIGNTQANVGGGNQANTAVNAIHQLSVGGKASQSAVINNAQVNTK